MSRRDSGGATAVLLLIGGGHKGKGSVINSTNRDCFAFRAGGIDLMENRSVVV